MGRPKLDEKIRRTEFVSFRVTKEEKERLTAHALRRGKSLPDWLKLLIEKALKGDFGHGV